ncbi:MAG: hypothetical protein ACLFR1_10765 [Spirochaetia bacterium]
MKHPKLAKLEKEMKAVFDEIDVYLEDKYGDMYPLHPARPPRGTTSSVSHDGLFNVGASFSAGYGSQYGRGYVVDVHMSTLSLVSEKDKEKILTEVMDLLRDKLKTKFPNRKLLVERDGNVVKIFGDFSLGTL